MAKYVQSKHHSVFSQTHLIVFKLITTEDCIEHVENYFLVHIEILLNHQDLKSVNVMQM